MDLPSSILDLERFIKNRVQESLHLDYKGSGAISEAQRREIAKDVSAFANSDGGTIIYGIKEDKHLPAEIDSGVDHSTFSREWLEQVILSNITPRIEGLRISQIILSDERSSFAVYVPKSFRGPHQHQSSKKYYKRFNFKSEPMEDYEINDVRSRAQTVKPLINVDVAIRHGMLLYLVIANIGAIPAEDVRVKFSQDLVWKRRTRPDEEPPLLSRGLKYFPPGRTFYIFYASAPEVFKKPREIYSEFDVTVSYVHPAIKQRIDDTFHIDFEDFLHTEMVESETYEQGRAIQDTIKKLTAEIKSLKDPIMKIARIAGHTGLDVSIRTIRNLRHTFEHTGDIEKIDPLSCDYQVFKEILGVGDDLAMRLDQHFWNTRTLVGLAEIEGVTDMVLEKVKRHFLLDD